MNGAAHTPGPWHMAEHRHLSFPHGAAIADYEYSVLARNEDHGKEGKSYSGEFLAIADGLDCKADACLIAAAPEQHEALRLIEALANRMIEQMRGETPSGVAQIRDWASAAIAKAEGR